MQRIGLIGVGNIGQFYTKQLLNAGYPLTVLDIDPAKVQIAVGLGAKAGKTPGAVVDQSDTIILSLPGSPQVEAVMDGSDGVLAHLRPGMLVIDTSTSRPVTAVKYDKLCAEKGAGFIDSPLTWRRQGQILMVGGSPENFAKGEEVLKVLSYKYKHIGPIGMGQMLKALNQAYLSLRFAMNAECVEFARQAGLDPRLMKDYLEFDVPEQMLKDDFVGTGQLTLYYKDLLYILEIAHECKANIPVTSLVHEIFKYAQLVQEPNWQPNGIVNYWRALNKP